MEEKKLLEDILSLVVSHKDEVRVEHSIDNIGELLTIYVHDEDKGFVIGKGGAMINSIRTIIRMIGSRRQASVFIVVFDPTKPLRSETNNESQGYRYNKNNNRDFHKKDFNKHSRGDRDFFGDDR